MKKNIIIGVLSIISLCFLLFAFVQKTQNEELEMKLIEAKNMANMCRAEAEHQKAVAEHLMILAQEAALRAELAAKRAMEAAQNTQ